VRWAAALFRSFAIGESRVQLPLRDLVAGKVQRSAIEQLPCCFAHEAEGRSGDGPTEADARDACCAETGDGERRGGQAHDDIQRTVDLAHEACDCLEIFDARDIEAVRAGLSRRALRREQQLGPLTRNDVLHGSFRLDREGAKRHSSIMATKAEHFTLSGRITRRSPRTGLARVAR